MSKWNRTDGRLKNYIKLINIIARLKEVIYLQFDELLVINKHSDYINNIISAEISSIFTDLHEASKHLLVATYTSNNKQQYVKSIASCFSAIVGIDILISQDVEAFKNIAYFCNDINIVICEIKKESSSLRQL